jgi:hypothetical protein
LDVEGKRMTNRVAWFVVQPLRASSGAGREDALKGWTTSVEAFSLRSMFNVI